jgi:hypothetical protein
MKKSVIGDLYGIADLSRATKVGYTSILYRVFTAKTLPEPRTKIGMRFFYTKSEFFALVSQISDEK